MTERPETHDAEIVAAVRSFLVEELQLAPTRTELAENDSLINSGFIDSLSVVQLVGFIESRYAIQLELEDFVAENFETLDRIAALVRSRLG